MGSFNQQFILSIIIIVLGFFINRFGWLGENEGDGLSRLIINVTLPSLIIYSFHDLTIEPSLLVLVLCGIIYGLILMGVGYLFFRKKVGKSKGMLLMMMPGLNIGLFAYPLVEGLFGQEGIQFFGMLDVGNALITFGMCYVIGSYYSGQHQAFDFLSILKKLGRSVPLMTYLVVFILSVLNLQLPMLLIDTAEVISRANMPLSLIVLGMFIHIHMDKSQRHDLLSFLSARFGVV
ncbi:AEC family transporter [Halolactibacillus sp. JCM 19043]|uniref:AEC family transporter n=1 Tax=Halolactibacillus sp. JCM 19043 TaxID=1460638 RepID=UPI0007803237|nr:AEC family transporter [Halolactibacillus sp. JCM 19043]